MRLHRIELLTDAAAVDLAFHHQTTIVAGLDRLEGEALALEMVASVRQGRPGLSADISTHAGRRLEIRRPLAEPPMAVDVDALCDVSDELTANGLIDPLTAFGVAASIRVTDADLAMAEQANDRVQRLARLDQDQLWGLAISLAELEVAAARQVDDAVLGDQISPEAAAQIEQARADVDIANQRLEELSDQSIVAASALVLISFAVAFITHPYVAVPFMMAALAVGWRSWSWHKEHEAALLREREILEGLGMESYLDFQLRKVDALTDDTKQRRSALLLAEKRRHAQEQWQRLVGSDVTLDWAATHRPTIAAAANRRTIAALASGTGENEAVSLALAERIRHTNALAEPSPLIVDDIFSAQNDATVERLLWLVDHHCQQLQFVLLSNDARVLRWAAERTIARQASILRLTERSDGEEIELDSSEAPVAEQVSNHLQL